MGGDEGQAAGEARGGGQRLVVLVGRPVGHSLSPAMQNAAMRAAGLRGRYVALDCGPDDVAALVEGVARGGGCGNVTIPHKEAVASLVERPSPRVLATGACNTFWTRDGRLHGDNTDVPGAMEALGKLGWTAGGTASRILLLGAGGAARAVLEGLREAGVDPEAIHIRNRTVARARELADSFGVRVDEAPPESAPPEGTGLLVNATSLGLGADDPLPLPPDRVPGHACVLDLVYRPGRTRWVRELASRGVTAEDGREMLLAQGARSFRLWWDMEPDRGVMRRALEAASAGEE